MASFLLCGLNFFSSSYFTALDDGLKSAIIPFGKTLVFQVAAVLVMSYLWGSNGLWGAVIVSETLTAALSLSFLLSKRRYGSNSVTKKEPGVRPAPSSNKSPN